MGLLYAGKTDIGMKRKSNQDSIVLTPENKFFMVADGMGGHNGGDIASAMAVQYVPEHLAANLKDNPIKILTKGIQLANQKIRERSAQDPNLKGMGTTAVSFLFRGDTVFVGNVGDSRAYLVNNKNIYQLSIDHSLVQQKLTWSLLGELKNYSRSDAQADPQKNVIVRTVGFEAEVEVDVYSYKVSRNDILFICSDGLHGKVSDKDILHIINQTIPDPSAATQQDVDDVVDKLINQANANGGNDNISVILIIAQ